MITRNIEATKQLKNLMNSDSFNAEEAMKLVRQGADPDIKTADGKPLIHSLMSQKKGEEYIKELVEEHNADIHVTNASGQTLLQRLMMNSPFVAKKVMTVLRLGANPNTKTTDGKSLFRFLGVQRNGMEYLEELEKYKSHQSKLRSDFLILLFILSNDRNNEFSNSYFKYLPLEIMLHFVCFLDLKKLSKTEEECCSLAGQILASPEQIKEMAGKPGGINVFQRDTVFTLFKSVQVFCKDFEKSDEKVRDEYKQYAIPYWKAHSSLYGKEANRQKLFYGIKDAEPYVEPEIQSQLKYS